eukprot:3147851-Prymnesium_polylepis.1
MTPPAHRATLCVRGCSCRTATGSSLRMCATRWLYSVMAGGESAREGERGAPAGALGSGFGPREPERTVWHCT